MPTPSHTIPTAPGLTECPIPIRFSRDCSFPSEAEIEFLRSILDSLMIEMDSIHDDEPADIVSAAGG